MLLISKFNLALLFAILSVSGTGIMLYEEDPPEQEGGGIAWTITEPAHEETFLDTASQIRAKGDRFNNEGGKVRLYYKDDIGAWYHSRTETFNPQVKDDWKKSFVRIGSHWPTPASEQEELHDYKVVLFSGVPNNYIEIMEQEFYVERTIPF